MQNKIQFIDELLQNFEDIAHGEHGEKVTLCRRYLSEISDCLSSVSVCCGAELIEFKLYGYRECLKCGETYKITATNFSNK